jgi:hypothetical protein
LGVKVTATMNHDDESELARLSGLLGRIDELLPHDAPEREALVKSGLALIQEFLRGNRMALEESFADIGAPLTEEQVAHLISLGLDSGSKS